MTDDFINDVIDRLARIEARAEGYITGKFFAGWITSGVVALLFGFWGIGQTQMSSLEKKFQDALKESENNIATATETYFETERGAILDLMSATIDPKGKLDWLTHEKFVPYDKFYVKDSDGQFRLVFQR